MVQQEAVNDMWQDEHFGYTGAAHGEEPLSSSRAGQKLRGDAEDLAPTVGLRLTLALISLGMLMGMSTLLTLLATRSPGWVAVLLLFVLTLFTAAVVSINVVFGRKIR